MTDAQGAGTRPSAQRIAGRYEVLGRLGAGPHGPTYRALDHRRIDASDSEREVALKILRTPAAEAPDFDARLAALVTDLHELGDDVLVLPLDAGRTELGLPYLALEVVRGTSLEDVLATEGALPPEEARALVLRLARTLQAVHDRGLVHGSLDTHQVLLAGAAREPRLMDVGLAALVDPGSERRERDDVRALGRLLAVLVTGDATGASLPADPELLRVVEEARAADGFQEASAIAAALSVAPETAEPLAGPAPGEPGEAPVLVRPGPSRKPLVFSMLLLAVLAAFTAWQVRGRVIAAAERETLAQEEAERERLARQLEQEAARSAELARELAATRVALAAEPVPDARLEERLSALAQELEETRAETAALREEKVAAERTLAETERERAAETARLTALEEERDRVRRELEEARRREEALRREADADALFAEDLAARVATGNPRTVWSWLRSPGALEGLDGDVTESPFLDAWTRASDLLERSATADALDIGPLVAEAGEALADARARQAGFVTRLRGALGKQATLETALEDALAAIEDGLEERLAARDAARQWEWNGLLDAPLEATPEEALRLAASFADDRREELLGAVARALDARYTDDGALDLEALRDGPALAPWAAALRDEPDAAHALPGAQAVLRYAWAQAWFAPEGTPLPWDWPLPGSEGESEALRALRLELELFRPDGPFPGPPGRRALYRTSTVDGRASWQIETVLPDGDPGSWQVRQRFYDADGRYQSERTLRIVREQRSLREEGVRQRSLYHARAEPRATTRWSPPAETPPTRLPITPDAIAAFQERLARAPLDALVHAQGTTTSLWSPRFGLVRHADPDLVTRELCYAD